MTVRDVTAPGPHLIELDAVSRSFETPGGRITAVDRVSLALAAGEAICLVGESGCGKTTTGRLLAGLLRPTGGRLLYEGKDVWEKKGADLAAFRRAVQLVHQDPYASLNPVRTVYDTLSAPLFRHHKARGRREAIETVRELLRRVGLTPPEDFLPKYPHQLSGGQRQRVAIARALSVDPRVVVADEAVSMVDVSIRITLLDLLLALRDEFGVSIVLITHDLAVARYFARRGRIGVMYLGRVVELAPTEALVTDPAHPYAAALIGAIPEADPTLTRTKERVPLRGADVPSLLDVPPGCSFHPRCPLFEAGLCDVLVPRLLPIPDEREVACHVAVRERTGSVAGV
ncbi:MAG TPA: ABC transporter ATP-binding protein [Candidatus Limnocylindria bacterium]|nr:ABC transporter ATP-binding protein [Candidatus Limnocylindria bacterium]